MILQPDSSVIYLRCFIVASCLVQPCFRNKTIWKQAVFIYLFFSKLLIIEQLYIKCMYICSSWLCRPLFQQAHVITLICVRRTQAQQAKSSLSVFYSQSKFRQVRRRVQCSRVKWSHGATAISDNGKEGDTDYNLSSLVLNTACPLFFAYGLETAFQMGFVVVNILYINSKHWRSYMQYLAH